jgi:hypothetical protein
MNKVVDFCLEIKDNSSTLNRTGDKDMTQQERLTNALAFAAPGAEVVNPNEKFGACYAGEVYAVEFDSLLYVVCPEDDDAGFMVEVMTVGEFCPDVFCFGSEEIAVNFIMIEVLKRLQDLLR